MSSSPPSPSLSGSASFASDPRRSYPGQDAVGEVFARVASRYDLMNDLASLGLHRLWKEEMVDAFALPRCGADYRLLDLACGSGDIGLACLRRCEGLGLVLADRSAPMLAAALRRFAAAGRPPPRAALCDAGALPFAAGSFDACAMAFGIRNVGAMRAALTEIRRILEPPGHFLCMEFSPRSPDLAEGLFRFHRERTMPQLGRWIVGDRAPYDYLAASVRAFPSPRRFAGLLEEAGFALVRHRSLGVGMVALFSARAV